MCFTIAGTGIQDAKMACGYSAASPHCSKGTPRQNQELIGSVSLVPITMYTCDWYRVEGQQMTIE